jgi:hypothetical protein
VDRIRELGLAGYIYGHGEYSFLLGRAADCGVYGLTSWAQNRNTINFGYPTGCPLAEKIPVLISVLVQVRYRSHP